VRRSGRHLVRLDQPGLDEFQGEGGGVAEDMHLPAALRAAPMFSAGRR